MLTYLSVYSAIGSTLAINVLGDEDQSNAPTIRPRLPRPQPQLQPQRVAAIVTTNAICKLPTANGSKFLKAAV